MTDHSLTRTIAHYAGSNAARQGLGVLTAFVRTRLLSPEQFGLWSLLALIPQYSGMLHLGSRSALSYRIPVHNRHGEEAMSAKLRGTVRLASFVPNAVVAVGLLIWSVWTEQDYALALMLSAVLVMSNWWFEHQLALLKSEQQFSWISRSNYWRAAVLLLATVAMIPLLGIAGALLAVILSLLSGTFLLRRQTRALDHSAFDWTSLKGMVRQGFPLLIVGLMLLLMRNTDRMMIAAMVDLHAVGLYALGGMILGFLINVPGVGREVLEPRLMQEMQHKPMSALAQPYLHDPLFKTLLLMPLLVLPLVMLMPLMVSVFLPAYVEGIPAIRVLLIGGFFLGLFYPMRGLAVAGHWQKYTVLHAAIALLFNVLGNWWVLQQGYGLVGVALVSVTAFALLMLMEYRFLSHRLAWKIQMSHRLLFWTIGFTVSLLSLLLVLWLSTQWPLHPHSAEALALLMFMLVYVPLVWWLYHMPHHWRMGDA